MLEEEDFFLVFDSISLRCSLVSAFVTALLCAAQRRQPKTRCRSDRDTKSCALFVSAKPYRTYKTKKKKRKKRKQSCAVSESSNQYCSFTKEKKIISTKKVLHIVCVWDTRTVPVGKMK
jgi:hypothetical protein